MLSLTEFLLARIAEDEADAESTQRDIDKWHREREATGRADGSQGSITLTGIFNTACDPARVLADCEAKRRIVEDYEHLSEASRGPLTRGALRAHAEFVVQVLAAPYADHPDYREEWKP